MRTLTGETFQHMVDFVNGEQCVLLILEKVTPHPNDGFFTSTLREGIAAEAAKQAKVQVWRKTNHKTEVFSLSKMTIKLSHKTEHFIFSEKSSTIATQHNIGFMVECPRRSHLPCSIGLSPPSPISTSATLPIGKKTKLKIL